MTAGRRAHDDRLLDALGEMEGQPFSGRMWRVVREGCSVLDGSRGAGRWNPYHLSVLYGTTAPDGAIAEIHYHLNQGQSVFPSRLRNRLHELEITTERTLILADLAQLASLGVEEARYREMLFERPREIADAAAFLGFDGIIAPSARWPCEAIVLFLDTFPLDNIEAITDAPIDWIDWRARNNR
ncbi:MAG: RES family NAD+ phosphorylase [Rhodospirillaceae bacterium]|jgi:RES domain-containing protein|nr:RES family NAD+ phosphorylase [Rhodospirillaceae bacterium]MBT3494806.1 RES family NAD+ phosphorylase [Rhodospirillaceae bacterium]MBT3782797.1 RES family NAD+ phosphorylase [Rhodospirillaceae bacterium]MBT3976534.1 RES family NAD+ phosphorylase [Rhodospirillaceae bacterium]MBT4564715.1 RES family NAD+ phosphorylase [Rhodospirillaceae bacterium]